MPRIEQQIAEDTFRIIGNTMRREAGRATTFHQKLESHRHSLVCLVNCPAPQLRKSRDQAKQAVAELQSIEQKLAAGKSGAAARLMAKRAKEIQPPPWQRAILPFAKEKFIDEYSERSQISRRMRDISEVLKPQPIRYRYHPYIPSTH